MSVWELFFYLEIINSGFQQEWNRYYINWEMCFYDPRLEQYRVASLQDTNDGKQMFLDNYLDRL